MLAILDALGYDATHVYEFHFGPKIIADSPLGGIGDEAAHTLTLGDMNLFEDGMFRIIYDMGDNHEMLVTCVSEGETPCGRVAEADARSQGGGRGEGGARHRSERRPSSRRAA